MKEIASREHAGPARAVEKLPVGASDSLRKLNKMKELEWWKFYYGNIITSTAENLFVNICILTIEPKIRHVKA